MLGGGIIGLEMGCVYDALGTRITVVELMDQIIPGADKDIVKPLHKRIERRYENIFLNTKVTAERVNKVYEGRPHIVDRMKDALVTLVFNTTEGAQAVRDSFGIRAPALAMKTPYYTTAAGAMAAARAIENLKEGTLEVAPLQDYLRRVEKVEKVGA